MRSSKPVDAHFVRAALRSARVFSFDQRRLVDEHRERGVLERDGGVGREPALGRARRGRRLELLDQLRGQAVDDLPARVLGELVQRAVARFAFLVLVLVDQEPDALPHAAARRHADQRERCVGTQVPRVLVMGHDGDELVGPTLGGLPALDVVLRDAATRRRSRECPERDHRSGDRDPPLRCTHS